MAGLQWWSVLANRIGRVATLRWGGALWIAACVISMLLPPLQAGAGATAMAPLVGLIMLVGFGASTAYLIPWSLLPDAIDADPTKPAGLYTAWMVFSQKLIIGLSMQLFGVLLSLSGYISASQCSGPLSYIIQPASAITMIRVCMGLIPAVMVVLGLLVMRGWPLHQKDVA